MADAQAATQLFENYEADYKLAYDELQQKIQEMPTLTSDQRPKASSAADRLIEESYELLDQLAVEIQNIPSSSRGQYNAKLREYKSNVDKSKRELKKIVDASNRSELFGFRDGDSDDIALDQRQQLLQGTASLDRSTQRLRDSQRIANETESIGANILRDLQGQREQIVNARNTLMEADGYVDKSIRTLRGMARR